MENTIGTVGTVSEPASLVLLAGGLFGMGAFAQRRNPGEQTEKRKRAGCWPAAAGLWRAAWMAHRY